MPDFEVKGCPVLTTTATDRAYGRSRSNPLSHLAQQALVMSVQAHITVTMIYDQQQAGAPQPVGVYDAPVMYGLDRYSFSGGNSDALPAHFSIVARGAGEVRDTPSRAELLRQ